MPTTEIPITPVNVLGTPKTLASLDAMMASMQLQVRDLALTYWQSNIQDPPPRFRELGEEKLWEADVEVIEKMIHVGLDWRAVRYDGDGDFEYCTAFLALCYASIGLAKELRYLYWASTPRLMAYIQYKRFFNRLTSPREGKLETAAMERFGPHLADGRQAGQRQLVRVNEAHNLTDVRFPDGTIPRAGDIALVGGSPGTYKAATQYPYGHHGTLVDELDFTHGVVRTVEANAVGLFPDGKRGQGIIRQERRVGTDGKKPTKQMHVRAFMRPSWRDVGLTA